MASSSMRKGKWGGASASPIVFAKGDALRRQIEKLVFAGGGLLEDVGALVREGGGIRHGRPEMPLE